MNFLDNLKYIYKANIH